MKILIFSIVLCGTLMGTIFVPGDQEKIVVLTFDDAVKSHLTYVAPLLKELKFGATFFITQAWMDDSIHFLSWDEIVEIHRMGFEIGNHSWTHQDFFQPVDAGELAGELDMVDRELKKHNIPRPVSYAHTNNRFGPEAVHALLKMDIDYARRGMQPEVPYGKRGPGPAFNPTIHHHLLIPTAFNSHPDMNMDDFVSALNIAGEKEIVVLQFHGIPDIVHPWVNTDPMKFKKYMYYLKDNGFKVIAMKDLEEYLPVESPKDPLLNYRCTHGYQGRLICPSEVISAMVNTKFRISTMKSHHF